MREDLMVIADPSAENAHEFAVILSSGMPAMQAIDYFFSDLSEKDRRALVDHWYSSAAVQDAILKLQGKRWQDMSLEEKISYTLDKNYAEQAYFLYSHNYSELIGHEKAKADDCRRSLEAKLSGMAGKMDALSTFWGDMVSGRIKAPNSIGEVRSIPS